MRIRKKENKGFILGEIISLSLCILMGCNNHDAVEKHFNSDEHLVEIDDYLHPIDVDENAVLLSDFATPYVLNDYLVVTDTKTTDNLIHIFGRKDFDYQFSLAPKGNGNGEIANLVALIPNEKDNMFHVIDYGKAGLLTYPMDSILKDYQYVPQMTQKINLKQVPLEICYVNDTLSYGLFTKFDSKGHYWFSTAKFNLSTGEISYMPYEVHPSINKEKKRVTLAVSPEHGLYVEAYLYHDLFSLCSLDGTLKWNIYGNKWSLRNRNRTVYTRDVVFCKNKIVAAYSGMRDEKASYVHHKLLIFDLEGNHLKTLHTEKAIIKMCYDDRYDRLILVLSDDTLLWYLNLKDVLNE